MRKQHLLSIVFTKWLNFSLVDKLLQNKFVHISIVAFFFLLELFLLLGSLAVSYTAAIILLSSIFLILGQKKFWLLVCSLGKYIYKYIKLLKSLLFRVFRRNKVIFFVTLCVCFLSGSFLSIISYRELSLSPISSQTADLTIEVKLTDKDYLNFHQQLLDFFEQKRISSENKILRLEQVKSNPFITLTEEKKISWKILEEKEMLTSYQKYIQISGSTSIVSENFEREYYLNYNLSKEPLINFIFGLNSPTNVLKNYELIIQSDTSELKKFEFDEKIELDKNKLISFLSNNKNNFQISSSIKQLNQKKDEIYLGDSPELKKIISNKLQTYLIKNLQDRLQQIPEEKVSFNQKDKQVDNSDLGLILKELVIVPLNLDSSQNINIFVDVLTCKFKIKFCCPQSTIKLLNFPKGAFIGAKGATNLKVDSEYLATEDFSWSLSSIDKEVRLAYIAPPFYHFRRFLEPVLVYLYVNKWFVVALGIFVAIVFRATLKPLVNIEARAVAGSQAIGKSMTKDFKKISHYNLQGAQFGGGLVDADTVNAHQIGGNIYNSEQQQNSELVKTILILAANPKTTTVLRLDEEVREIDSGLQRAKKRDQFDLKQRWAVQIQDVYQSLLDFKPQIVHFSGHGTGDDGLVLEDETGNVRLVDTVALAGLFELFASDIECVILNACYSQVQASAISQHIPYVIGMKKEVGDKAAIKFATGFYSALGAGESVEFAYKLGCSVIQLDGIAEHLTPVLKKK